MKKSILKTLPIVILSLLFIFMFASCGDDQSHDVTGNDWRTQGLIDGYGSLTLNGDDISVCICCHNADASVYLDSESQELIATLTYPSPIAEDTIEERAFDFSDINGDGSSDVTMTVIAKDGSKTVVSWVYDTAENGFVISDSSEDTVTSEE